MYQEDNREYMKKLKAFIEELKNDDKKMKEFFDKVNFGKNTATPNEGVLNENNS